MSLDFDHIHQTSTAAVTASEAGNQASVKGLLFYQNYLPGEIGRHFADDMF